MPPARRYYFAWESPGAPARSGAPSNKGALQNVSSAVQILPNWSWMHYLAYVGYTAAVGVVMLAIGVYVFGRLEANFAEEL